MDITDQDGSLSLPMAGETHLAEDLVVFHFSNYGSFVSLAHFKGRTMADIGILASLNPVAFDQTYVDLVFAAADGKDLQSRITSHNGVVAPEQGEAIGFGSRHLRAHVD